MSGNNLTVDGEFRYIIQWFNEWSELQREDFLPVLMEYLSKDGQEIYMNGVVQGIANYGCNDKPMSLFQCRIKLFKEWCRKWPEDFKIKLKEKVIEMDSNFGEKLQKELESITPNGIVGNSADDEANVEPEETDQIVVAPVVEEIAAAAVAVAQAAGVAAGGVVAPEEIIQNA